MSDLLLDVRRQAIKALLPPPRKRLSEWAEENVYLPEGVSALPGRVRLWPYQYEIADAIGDPTIERVTLVKPVRVGFPLGCPDSNEPLRFRRRCDRLCRKVGPRRATDRPAKSADRR